MGADFGVRLASIVSQENILQLADDYLISDPLVDVSKKMH
jgi:hypothetical protein